MYLHLFEMWSQQPEAILSLLSKISPAPPMHCWVLIRDGYYREYEYTYRLLHRDTFGELYDEKIEWNKPISIDKYEYSFTSSGRVYDVKGSRFGFAAVDYTYYIQPFTKSFELCTDRDYVSDSEQHNDHVCFFSKIDWIHLYGGNEEELFSSIQLSPDITINPELLQRLKVGGKMSDVVQLLEICFPSPNDQIWCGFVGDDYELKDIDYIFDGWIDWESTKITSEVTPEGESYYRYSFDAYQSLEDSDPTLIRSTHLFTDRGYVDDYDETTGQITRYFSAQAWINKFGHF